MINICIIGDSHTGALKRAWNKIENIFPKIEITFFAQRAKGLNHLIIQDSKLVPDNKALATALEFTSGGKREIDTQEYDLFIIYGLDAKANLPIENEFFSSAVISTAIEDLTTTTLSFKLLNQLRGLTNKPIYIGHNPLPAGEKIALPSFPQTYKSGIKNINKIVYKPLQAEIITQPKITVINGRTTHPRFSKGSKRLEVGSQNDNDNHPENDIWHMNEEFGEIWLKCFIKKHILPI